MRVNANPMPAGANSQPKRGSGTGEPIKVTPLFTALRLNSPFENTSVIFEARLQPFDEHVQIAEVGGTRDAHKSNASPADGAKPSMKSRASVPWKIPIPVIST